MKDSHSPKGEANTDWLCLNCSNLNYSFRKVCNRCKSITREENQQNYLQMQYMQIYYQQPYVQTRTEAEEQLSVERKLSERKVSSQGSDASDINDFRSLDWNNSETQNTFVFLLENAWEGLYNPTEVSQFKSQQSQKTREQEQSQESQGILTNFDFTFI